MEKLLQHKIVSSILEYNIEFVVQYSSILEYNVEFVVQYSSILEYNIEFVVQYSGILEDNIGFVMQNIWSHLEYTYYKRILGINLKINSKMSSIDI